MKYFLAEASQNTFLLFDCMELDTVDSEFLQWTHAQLIKEKRDDVLILMGGKRQGNSLYARMVVLGGDGAFGEFCGNGALACAAYLFSHYPSFQRFSLVTPWGDHPLEWHGHHLYSVTLPLPRLERNPRFMTRAFPPFHYVETIEPHLVIQAEMSDEELLNLGKILHRQTDLFPLGININAWHFLPEGGIYVKTYERGVQRLTKSCGTGSISCVALLKKEGTYRVSTPGGTLEVTLQHASVRLKGNALVSPSLWKKRQQ